MDRNTALIVTALSVFLCACPGLALCSTGGLMAFGASLPDCTGDCRAASILGVVMLVFGLFISLIPLVVGVVSYRMARPPEPPADVHQPLPPAI
jgi:hypothetical protein